MPVKHQSYSDIPLSKIKEKKEKRNNTSVRTFFCQSVLLKEKEKTFFKLHMGSICQDLWRFFTNQSYNRLQVLRL